MIITREYVSELAGYCEYLCKKASSLDLLKIDLSTANDGDYFSVRIRHANDHTHVPFIRFDVFASHISDWHKEFDELCFDFYVLEAAINYLEGVIISGFPVLASKIPLLQDSLGRAA